MKNEILKAARKLNDSDLKSVIKTLTKTLEKREEKALLEEQERARELERIEQTQKEVIHLISDRGFSLESIGLALVGSPSPAPKKKPKKPTDPTKQTFILDENGHPKPIFTRQIKIYKDKGLALSYDQLTVEQKKHLGNH